MSQTNLVANTYNPHNQSPEELISGFVVRQKEFDALYSDIMGDPMKHPPQHVIIQGRRGSGKTSFLLRIYYEIKRDPALSKWLLPIIFNEEIYSVRTLYKLWEHIAVELENNDDAFRNLPDEMQTHLSATDYEEMCINLLQSALQKQKKKLLLLIDNFGDMLQKFTEHEQQRLREVLITSTDIKIVGASSVALESTYNYDKPFFEYFRIINLDGLSKDETITLLLSLGEKYHKEQIREIIEKNPGKIEALRRLTDGVPRTMILLFEIFVDDAAGDSFKDLEMVLDRVTPLYKHRMDDLSPQQQELIDIIALAWDAIPVKEIAQKTRMESKAISAQLRLLEKNKIIIKKPTSTKNHLYQVSERFFNIWYLMRCGRKKDKNKVQWLTRFLEEWCNKEELMHRAEGHISALKNGVLYEPSAFYMTEALAKTRFLPAEMQDTTIKLVKMADDYYSNNINKAEALEYITKAWNQNLEIEYQLFYPLILLWNDDIDKSTSIAFPLFQKPDIFEFEYVVNQYLQLLIAKHQYNFTLKLFNESPLDLRERYKPLYYALMFFMKSEYPDEFKKMGSELEQTVMELVEEIKVMEKTM